MRATRPPKLQGVLLLALLLSSQVLALAHFALVPHSVCPADGEIAHGAHHHVELCHDEHAPDVLDEGEPASVTRPEAEHGEHCSLAEFLTHRELHLNEPSVRVQPASFSPCTVVGYVPPPGGDVPVYLYAPKQSPPRAS